MVGRAPRAVPPPVRAACPTVLPPINLYTYRAAMAMALWIGLQPLTQPTTTAEPHEQICKRQLSGA